MRVLAGSKRSALLFIVELSFAAIGAYGVRLTPSLPDLADQTIVAAPVRDSYV